MRATMTRYTFVSPRIIACVALWSAYERGVQAFGKRRSDNAAVK